MKKLELSIKTTSLCQRQCKNCTVRPWMKANPEFHTSIEQLEAFVKYSKLSGYHWEYILLSGGEPLLWNNILEGTKLLYESGITSRLILLTNGLEIMPATLTRITKIINNVHEFRVSEYGDNKINIALAKEYFGKIKNSYGNSVLNIVDRQEHLVPPENLVKDSLPVECTCQAYAMDGDFIRWCGPALTLDCAFPQFLGAWPVVKRKLISQKNFLDGLELQSFFCQYCIANSNVTKTLKKEKS